MSTPAARPRSSHAPRSPSTGRSLAALLRRGLLDRRSALLTWGGSVGLMCAFTAAVYPSVEDSLNKAVQGYPAGLKEAFGISELNTIEKYLSAEMFSLVVPLALAFYAVRSMVRALPSSEESGQLNVLLSTPLPRRRLVGGAFLSTAASLLGVLAVIGVLTWIAASLAGSELSLGLTATGVLSVWPLALFFAGVTALANGVTSRAGAVTEVAAGCLVAMYVLDLVGKLAEGLEQLRYLSVFKYYGTAIVDGIDIAAFAGLTVAAAGLATIGALLFERRDLAG